MDIFLADIDQEIFSLYHNNHDLTFEDVSMELGIGMRHTLVEWLGTEIL